MAGRRGHGLYESIARRFISLCMMASMAHTASLIALADLVWPTNLACALTSAVVHIEPQLADPCL